MTEILSQKGLNDLEIIRREEKKKRRFLLHCWQIRHLRKLKSQFRDDHKRDPNEFEPEEKYIYPIDTSTSDIGDQQRKGSIDLLMRVYSNHHFWLRNYDTLVITMVSFISAAVVGYVSVLKDSFGPLSALSISILILIGFISTDYMLNEVNNAWKRVVKLEKIFGLYQSLPLFECQGLLEINGDRSRNSTLFEEDMRETGERIPPLFIFSLWVYFGLFIFVLFNLFVLN